MKTEIDKLTERFENFFIAWEESNKVVHKLRKYFGGEIIGSVLLFKEGYLTSDLINDIDVLVSSNKLQLAKEYLEENGYKEKDGDTTFTPGYAILKGSLLFEKENRYPIHLCNTDKKLEVYSLEKLFIEKFKRMNDSDYKQLLSMIEYRHKSKHPYNICNFKP